MGSVLSADTASSTSDPNSILTKNPFRYRGYYCDKETGFYYLQSRYYDPGLGRFINADDAGILDADQGHLSQYNLFAYCLSNPVNMADNNGQLPFFLATGAAGALIDGIIGYATTGSWKGALAGAAIGLTGGAAAGYLLAGKAWHHIVEQTASNVSEFGAQTIHNAKNIVRISHGAGQLHNKISGYYSSIQRFTNGMTVRQWLQTKDYNFQYNFGLETLTRFAEELGAKIEFIE